MSLLIWALELRPNSKKTGSEVFDLVFFNVLLLQYDRSRGLDHNSRFLA